MLIDYKSAIHPKFAIEHEIVNDIVITPFWREEFCKEMLNIAKFYDDRFRTDGWTHDLQFWALNGFLFADFAIHYKKHVIPFLTSIFEGLHYRGITSPYVVRHRVGESTDLHNDISKVSLSLKLNNDYKGGEVYFPRQKFSNRDLPIGYTLFWPGDVTHPHKINEVTKGTKYTVAGFTLPSLSDSTPFNTIMFDELPD